MTHRPITDEDILPEAEVIELQRESQQLYEQGEAIRKRSEEVHELLFRSGEARYHKMMRES